MDNMQNWGVPPQLLALLVFSSCLFLVIVIASLGGMVFARGRRGRAVSLLIFGAAWFVFLAAFASR